MSASAVASSGVGSIAVYFPGPTIAASSRTTTSCVPVTGVPWPAVSENVTPNSVSEPLVSLRPRLRLIAHPSRLPVHEQGRMYLHGRPELFLVAGGEWHVGVGASRAACAVTHDSPLPARNRLTLSCAPRTPLPTGPGHTRLPGSSPTGRRTTDRPGTPFRVSAGRRPPSRA